MSCNNPESPLRKLFTDQRNSPVSQLMRSQPQVREIQELALTRDAGDGRYTQPNSLPGIIAQNSGQVDHGQLQGLADDDHSQYHNDTRGDARYVKISTLTTKGDIFARSSSAPTRVAVGSNGQVLTADSSASAGVSWQTPAAGVTDHGALSGLGDDDHSQYHNDTRGDARYVKISTLTTKGDIYGRSSSAVTRLGVGSNGQVLTADSSATTGLVWATPATGAPVDAQYLTLANSGTLTTERVLTAGAGLTGTDAGANSTYTLALTTPGTLTAVTSNSSSGSHTHAITSSSNPQANASLLASNSSGELYLRRLFINDEEHVNGRFVVSGSSGFAMLVCDVANDRVGVRVTNPTTQFHVSGNALITGNGNFGGGITVGHDTNQAPARVLTFRESSSRPATPAAGFFHLYIFSGALEMMDDAGVVTTY